MAAMDKMIASMLGITPEGMHEMVGGFQSMIIGLNAKLTEIQEDQKEILTLLKGKEDGGSIPGSVDRNSAHQQYLIKPGDDGIIRTTVSASA